MPLDEATIARLVELKNKPKAPPVPRANPQVGPLRYIGEKTAYCTSRRCMSPAYYAVQGAPKCSIHALEELNEMLVAQGFKGVTNTHTHSPTPVPSGRIVSSSTRAYLGCGWAVLNFECIHGIALDKECNGCSNND